MIVLNSVEIIPTRFPDNTQQVWHLPKDVLGETNFVTWKFESEVELMTLAQLRSLIGVHKELVLTIPFLPYARQDKEISNDSCFALTTFMQFLMDVVRPDKLVVFDPHSTDILKTYCSLYNVELEIYMPNLDTMFAYANAVLFPDEGAAKRYKFSGKSYTAEKERDPATGKILGIKLPRFTRNSGRIVVVDDICDGGATFLILARALYENVVFTPELYVSHGIFSKGEEGVQELYNYYSNIMTTNSLARNTYDPYNVHVYNWESISKVEKC